MRRECWECFPRNRGLAIPTCVMHAGVANWWFPLKSMVGKTFPAHVHPQFYVYGKSSMDSNRLNSPLSPEQQGH